MEPALTQLVLAFVALGAGTAALTLPTLAARFQPKKMPVPRPPSRGRDPMRELFITLALSFLGAGVGALVANGVGLVSIALGLMAPLAFLQLSAYSVRRYQDDFRGQFLPALEVIVRGVKAGMPLIAALQVVQKEVGGSVQMEFGRLLDDLSLGMTLAQAVERLAARIPSRETLFFAHVVAMQSRTGGRLSEALGNLADALRARDQFAQKVRVLSQEARTSAIIIGALPFVIAFLLFMLNPSYVSVLFTTPMGQVVVAISLMWMGVGALIMKRMVEIDV
jgi:tight adherence protein B